MECSDALTLISGHIDEQNTPQEEAALQAHLQICPDCRRLLDAYVCIDAGVSELNEPAPEGLADAVMSRIRAEKPKKQRRPWRSVGAAAGLVAAVLVLLIGTKTIRLPMISDNKKAPVNDAAEAISVTDAPAQAAPDEEPACTLACAGTAAAPESTPAPAETDAPMGQDIDPAYTGGIPLRRSKGFAPLLLDSCQTLAAENSCAVLLCEGFGTEFFDWLKDIAPELAEQFASLEAGTDDELGTVTVKTTYTAVAALQEWFSRVFAPKADASAAVQLQDELTALGLDGRFLAKLYTFPEDFSIEEWPENWPEDFAERWLAGENRQLFYPTEDYIPAEDDAAYLVLLPPVVEETP